MFILGLLQWTVKSEFGEARGGGGKGERDAALLLPMEHTVRCAFHTISQREVTVWTLLYVATP